MSTIHETAIRRMGSDVRAATPMTRAVRARVARVDGTWHAHPACACGGSCPRCEGTQGSGGRVVSSPDHPLERQADRIAATVTSDGVLPRVSGLGRAAAPTRESGVFAAPGEPLADPVRQEFEASFGRDFSHVRVHTDRWAAESAADIGAEAYTCGHDIAFAAGRYAPATTAGRRLIAHELVHVAQGSRDVLYRQPQSSQEGTSGPSRESFGAPYRLEIANPFTDVEAHASLYELAPALIGRLSAAYNIDEKVAWRLFEWAAAGITFMTAMTYSHERGGHAGVGRRFGWDPTVTLDAPWSGETSRGVPPGVIVTPEQDISFITGGVNQETINASRMASQWALRGDISYQEAMAYLYAKTNLAAYAVRTYALSITQSKDDVYSYVTKQGSLSVGELMAIAAVADLLSGPAWAALLGQWNYLAHGERRVRIPTFRVGQETRATLPNWQLLLSSRGPLLGGRSTINFLNGRLPVEVSIDTSLDEPGAAVGAQVHWSPAPDLRLSALGRVSFSESEGAGGLAGVEAQYQFAPWLGVSARLTYRTDDLLTQAEGATEGLAGRAALTFEF